MSNNKKFAMFSNGSAIVTNSAGEVRTASKAEIVDYLKTLVPSEKEGSKLAGVKYDAGYVHAKYASGKVFKKKVLVAQNSSAKQTEPTNSGDKADPDLKVPRNESKAKPETSTVTKDRPDVKTPTKVRNEDSKRGKGGEDSHTDVVPRSKGDSGLKGSSKTEFCEEEGNKATSGKPDSYVQEFKEYKDPTPAGNELNHAAKSGVQLRPESEIYDKVKIAFEQKREAKSDLTPWEKNKDGATNNREAGSQTPQSNQKEAELLGKLKQAEQNLADLKKEINRYKLREVRQAGAVKLALAYRDMSPSKYASAQAFLEKVDHIAKKMSPEAMETAFDELASYQKEASHGQSLAKTASNVVEEKNNEGGVATVFSGTVDEINPKGEDQVETLKQVLMSSSTLNKRANKFDSWKKDNSLEN